MSTKQHLIAVIKKPADKNELLSIIKYFGIKRLSIITYTNNPRINESTISDWTKDLKITPSFYKLDRAKVTSQNFIRFLDSLGEFKYLAIPISNIRPFYKAVPLLKKSGKTIIHISDGTPDAFSLWGYGMGAKVKSFPSFIKATISYFEYRKAKANFCFFQLHPLKCCFSENTLPLVEVGVYADVYSEHMRVIETENINTLVVPGWGETVESLIELFPETKSYCATSKDKQINVNGNWQKIDHFITAEDVLKTGKIKKVIGTASTAVLFAKIFDPTIECFVVLNGFLNKQFGRYFERHYRILGEKIGIKFIFKN